MIEDSKRRTLASYVSPRAFAPGARAALEALGYRVVAASTQGTFASTDWPADLRLVDERHLSRLPADGTPVILLSGTRGGVPDDPRVVGCVPTPVEVNGLYPILQAALEPHPRLAARAPAQIPARCIHSDRRWSGEVLRLSQTGCFFHTTSDLPAGLELNLNFPLPLGRVVSTRAEVTARLDGGAGMAFRNTSAQVSHAIAEYVHRKLATLRVQPA